MRQGAHLVASDLRRERGAQGVLGAGVPGRPYGLAPGQGEALLKRGGGRLKGVPQGQGQGFSL